MLAELAFLLTPGLLLGAAIFCGAMAERADFYQRRIK